TGTNDVSPGIYVWIGEWVPQFSRKQSALYRSDIGLLSKASDNYKAIDFEETLTFEAEYTGNYRIDIKVNFGGGNAKVPNPGSGGSRSNGRLNIAKASGKFR